MQLFSITHFCNEVNNHLNAYLFTLRNDVYNIERKYWSVVCNFKVEPFDFD